MFKGISHKNSGLIFLSLLIIAAITLKNDKFRVSVKCRKCGRATCRRCQRISTADNLCSQCINLSSQQECQDFTLIEKHKLKTTKHLKSNLFMESFLSFILPGAGQLWKNHPFMGITFLLLFFFFTLNLTLTILIEGPWDFIAHGKTAGVVMLSLISLLIWACSIINSLHMKNKSITDRTAYGS